MWVIATMLLAANTVKSQETLSIPRIQEEFRFDGLVNDPCWVNVQPLSMTMHTPVFGNQPTEKSEVMVAYDNTYIYIGARLYDSQAEEMLVTSKKGMKTRQAMNPLPFCLIPSMTMRMPWFSTPPPAA